MPIPGDWASAKRSPQIFVRTSPDWDALRRRFAKLGPSKPLEAVFDVVERNGVTHALLEPDYIDADYRDEFANFYASTFPPFPDRCERLHFFNQEQRRYLGYSVMRPVPRRPVCRTMLAPPDELAPFVSCMTDSFPTPYGQRLRIRGFPFIGQDHQYGVCAHASIWMTALYHHLAHRRDRYHLSDLVRAAGAHQEADRLIPSSGLTASQMAGVFRAIRLPAMYYDIRKLPKGERRASVVCRYLNSGLPVVLATIPEDPSIPGHATALVGYRRDSDGFTFIRNDDAAGPYRERPFVPLDEDERASGDWRGVLVGLPGRIYLPGESAEERARIFLRSRIRRLPILRPLRAEFGSPGGRWRLRSYVTESSTYKRELLNRGLPADLARKLRGVSMSHWVWVTELQDRQTANTGAAVLGEVVIDATSDRLRPRILTAYVPGQFMQWPMFSDAYRSQKLGTGIDDRFASGGALPD